MQQRPIFAVSWWSVLLWINIATRTTTSSLLFIRRRGGSLMLRRRRRRPPSPAMMASPTTTTQQSHHSHSRGIYFGGFQQPVYERTEEKVCLKPQRNHLLVQVHAVGLNPVDAKQVIGDKLAYEWKTIRKVAHNLLVKHTRVGFDFAGISMNEHHPEFPIGTRVFGTMPPLQGSCAEYIQVPLHQVAKSPQQWSMEEAAAMPLVGLTAWQALSPCIAPEKSSRVLIIGGSGGTGHVALQVAKALGAHDIVTICSTRNIDFCKECGATQVLDYTQSEDIMQDLQQLVSRQQQQFDVILDCVTSADPEDARHEYPKRVRNSTLGIVAPNHLYQRLGGTWSDWIRAGLARTRLFPIKWLWKDPRERLFWIRFPHSSHELEELAGLSSQLKPKIQKVYPEMTAATVQQAFGDILSRRVQGKVVIQVVVPPSKEDE